MDYETAFCRQRFHTKFMIGENVHEITTFTEIAMTTCAVSQSSVQSLEELFNFIFLQLSELRDPK